MTDSTSTSDEDLTLIPRSLRDKLDRAAIKLHLREWQLLSMEQRRSLFSAPCDTPEEIQTFAARLEQLVMATCGHPPERLAK